MNLDDRLVFNHRFFEHALEYKSNSNALKIILYVYGFKAFQILMVVIEKTLTFILTLPIPIYSDLVLGFVTNMPGLPRMFGCYLRALYFRGKIKKMEPNVLIEQGVCISNPDNTILKEFAYIDKYVILAADSVYVGRRVHIAPYVIITGGGSFHIEDYACIATGSRAITATESLKPGTRSSGPMVAVRQRDIIKGSIYIGTDAFIAVGVTLLTNSYVSDGVVVGAHTVFSGKSDEWSFYLGVDGEANPIRSRAIKKRKPFDLPDS